MTKRVLYQIDSFTKELFKGNPAGVIVNADGLSEKQMQRIARELNNSETAFIFSPDSSDYDCEIRFFTPTTEVPTCGHATIAALYAKALEGNLVSQIIKIKTRIGILPCAIEKENGDYRMVMTQGKFELSQVLDEGIIKNLLVALDLGADDLDRRCPVQIASTGHSKVIIGIKSRTKLNTLVPNFSDLADLSKQISCNGYFVFTFDSDDKNILTYGRMFAPIIGINEDPVTGNANGPLGGYLVQNRLVQSTRDVFEFKARQGQTIDRPGEMNVCVKIENDLPVRIQIKGVAVVVFRAELDL